MDLPRDVADVRRNMVLGPPLRATLGTAADHAEEQLDVPAPWLSAANCSRFMLLRGSEDERHA
jgi:hypothetical protein